MKQTWLSIRPRLIVTMLLSLSILQGFRTHEAYGKRYFQLIYPLRSETALDRSAILSEGQGFADYMSFLRKTIPEDGKVILPPHEPVQPMANIGFMQYFLMPRDIQNCGVGEVEGCILRMEGPTSYIITAWKFPPPELALKVKQFIPFTGGEGGVYAPK